MGELQLNKIKDFILRYMKKVKKKPHKMGKIIRNHIFIEERESGIYTDSTIQI